MLLRYEYSLKYAITVGDTKKLKKQYNFRKSTERVQFLEENRRYTENFRKIIS